MQQYSRSSNSVRANGQVAVDYAGAGIPVFPCVPAGRTAKRPLTPRGHNDASIDRNTISQWWGRWPGALVGIPTGPGSGLWVLDVYGDAGRRTFDKLLHRLGLNAVAQLSEVVSRTPSGGMHLFFALQDGEHPRTRAGDIGPGVDTRGVRLDGAPGGYFVAPGSVLPDGRRYRLHDIATLEKREGCA